MEEKETDCPIVQCINNDCHEIKKLLNCSNIHEVYPYGKWNDYINLLTAAVINRHEEMCTVLLQEGADPNKVSKNGLTPLHYVSLSKAPLAFVTKLLKAKANPNGCGVQPFTPLQTAAINDRDDVMKELISAGALVTIFQVNDPEHITHNKKISQMIHNLASKGDKLCSKIRHFLDMEIAVRGEPSDKVFKTFDSHMLQEHPQTHLTMIEVLFNVNGPGSEKYRVGSIKWLKNTENMNTYIADAVSRLPNIPAIHVKKAIDSLHAVICTMEDISNEQALAVIPQLLDRLCSEEKHDILEAVVQTLYVITQKSKDTDGWDPNFQKLCKIVAPMVEDQHITHSIDNIFPSGGLTSVPEDIVTSADMKMLKDLKEVLRRLKNLTSPNLECEYCTALPGSKTKKEKSQKQEDPNDDEVLTATTDLTSAPIVESTSNVKPFHFNTTPKTHKWLQISKRWERKIEKLLSTDDSKVTRIGA
ncbi:uncharacterized protein LOC118338298 [Morone saxatilis]|uniref:uncharacterized protein LOC118338298 n=1 Tax=Morone saxatilis TaxID=34816 RepID=UPI0015E1F7FB|nr:uncharacterized protein LOC118338298 [Morone saxatilis]